MKTLQELVIGNLQEECRSPLQYTGTSFYQQKEQRTHRNQNPMPKTQKQQPPAEINEKKHHVAKFQNPRKIK